MESSPGIAASSIAAPPPAAGGASDEASLKNLLDTDGKERIVRLKTLFDTLTPIEKQVFLLEIGAHLVESNAQKQKGRGKAGLRGNGALGAEGDDDDDAEGCRGPVSKVRQDTLTQYPHQLRLSSSPSSSKKQVKSEVPAALHSSIQKALGLNPFGSTNTDSTPQENSENQNEGAAAGGDESSQLATAEASVHGNELARREVDAPGTTSSAPPFVRITHNRIYQALRASGEDGKARRAETLLHVTTFKPEQSEGQLTVAALNEEPDEDVFSGKRILNVSSDGYDEADLAEWFSQLDEDKDGFLSGSAFIAKLQKLQRDFGGVEAMRTVEAEITRLAGPNDQLSFDAFAFIVCHLSAL